MRRMWGILFAAGWLILVPASPCGQTNEIRSLAGSLAQDIASAGKRSIAVVDFTDLQGNPTELGRFLAEEFAVALTRTRKGFEIVDRNHLNTLLKEHELASTGLIDPATAKKLGQIAGVDAIVTGSLTPFGDSVRVAVKVLAVDTARMITADNADLPKTRTIEELLGRAPQRRAADAPGARPSATAAASGVPTAAGAEFVFELAGCRAVGATVRCPMKITNRGPDRALECWGSHWVAYDNFGNELEGREFTIANRRNDPEDVRISVESERPSTH